MIRPGHRQAVHLQPHRRAVHLHHHHHLHVVHPDADRRTGVAVVKVHPGVIRHMGVAEWAGDQDRVAVVDRAVVHHPVAEAEDPECHRCSEGGPGTVGHLRTVEGSQEAEAVEMAARLTKRRRILHLPRFKTMLLVWCLEAAGSKGTSNRGVI